MENIKEYDNIINNKEGVERRYKYDDYLRTIYLKIIFKNKQEIESCYKWDGMEQIEITKQEFKQIERNKIMYLNNKKSNRFELMDI
jgi:hypothetical protein